MNGRRPPSCARRTFGTIFGRVGEPVLAVVCVGSGAGVDIAAVAGSSTRGSATLGGGAALGGALATGAGCAGVRATSHTARPPSADPARTSATPTRGRDRRGDTVQRTGRAGMGNVVSGTISGASAGAARARS